MPFKCPHCELELSHKRLVRCHINFVHLKRRPPTSVSKALILLEAEGLVRCAICKAKKPTGEFWKNRFNTSGYCVWCKACMIERRDRLKATPAFAVYSIRGSAKARSIPFELTADEIKAFWRKPCVYCGDVVETIGIDRVDNSKGYTLDNIVSCCTKCNYMKQTLTVEEFITHCRKIIHHSEISQSQIA